MNTFSADETWAMVISGFWAVVFLCCWYAWLIRRTRLGLRTPWATLAATPVACLAGLLFVLIRFGSHELRDDHDYVVLFIFAGVIWMSVTVLLCAAMGIHPRDDAVDRRNKPAAIAVSGALTGATLCYAGANIGEGPSIWMTFIPAALATAAWAGSWALYQRLTNVADAVAIDRDPAAACRLAGLLVATGLVLGRSVASDYESARHTLRDFVIEGWPAVVLTIAAARIDRLLPPKFTARAVARGALPAIAYVAAAAAYVALLGPWNHLPHGGVQ